MQAKNEIRTLKEMLKVHDDCEERVRFYQNRSFILVLVAIAVFALAYNLFKAQYIGAIFLLELSGVGGVLLGFAFFYSASSQQAPIFSKYSNLDVEAIQKRILELEA